MWGHYTLFTFTVIYNKLPTHCYLQQTPNSLLSTTNYQLTVIYNKLPTHCYLQQTPNSLLSTTNYQLTVIYNKLPTHCYLQQTTNSLLSTTNYQLTVIYNKLPTHCYLQQTPNSLLSTTNYQLTVLDSEPWWVKCDPRTACLTLKNDYKHYQTDIHLYLILLFNSMVECDGSLDQSLMVDPVSYLLFQPVLHDWYNKGCGVCCPVYGMDHIKEPLQLI